MNRTAILSALPDEQQGLLELLQQAQKTSHAGRDFWQGVLHGQPVVLALSKIGKVAAATTATALIERFGVQRMVFTGVAGGLGAGVRVGDVVIATDFLQHDLDVSPLFPRYEVPFYGKACFGSDTALTARLHAAACDALAAAETHRPARQFADARVHRGLLASGDRFVSGAAESSSLRATLAGAGHEVLAVEMEGAAVAQVCLDYGVPFAAMRTISDRADDSAHVDFSSFVEQVASQYARAIMERFLLSLSIK
ncbi:MAG: 5'-methylthioadenosine/adenosylhomocysteine nucleosidase [Polaromonas sp.]|uniref:5'-methylthioadenosine/adenosylhomocysteine nucleosidase n=1 Tax=Polaromonas sp. TaxID=1869339 RepID=UPI00272F666F|nr:5'-methylthioadenosine/adenosylhomocysteine nucleosidase [Polaromonas sp.]MDP2450953.1 5'-methylthioadenosine/adenosylhomocysteine nucleosidase [Polaromonas sp.]MDP3247290.1 5'-methylthioadenosine/adenosylhomocysteine nucleosidase [Polaromonas sp.]MDP3757455.1 5'-methylthioadenosine/adenosylhomocysteine nucleosidase [Polaromonas sp.]MDP3827578.1 5'-methylthioadenosine/adenosylhomocysteine nucleosidase [Polaromonas sp.]